MKTTGIALSAATLLSTAAGRQFVQYVSGSNNGDDTLVERSDPILNPNAVSGHVHQIFGGNAFGPDASYESLQQSDCTTVGAADGSGNAQDKSAYWHPSLYMEKKDGSGYLKVPTSTHKIYYRDFGSSNDKVINPFEFPKGFRMIAGTSELRAPNSNEQYQNITQWICHTSSGPWGVGASGGFPTGVTDCDAYPGFNGAIDFPHCWNGEDFDQNNPTAHMSYADGDPVHGDCPSSHPTRVPHIFMENQFEIHAIVDQVKPDSFVLGQGDPTGYGWHVDFFNGWDEGAISELFNSCPAPYYGNEDIGTCPSYKKFETSQQECKLKTTYEENVETPGQNLPGCNPVTTVNPAPKMAVAAVGVAEGTCAAAGGSSGGSSGSSSAAAPMSSSYRMASSSSSAAMAPSSISSSSSSSSEEETTAAASSTPTAAMETLSVSITSTIKTSPSTSASAPSYHSGSHSSKHENSHNDPDIVWVTEFVTVYARDLPTPVPEVERGLKARRDHAQHLAMHKRHGH